MKILVTGATGFVGSHLCDSLSRLGHEVYALVRNPKKAKEFSVPGTHVRGDLSQFDWVQSLPPDLDAVVHTAGLVHSFHESDFLNTNAEATKNLIAALEHYKQLKFLLVSSQAAAGPATKESPANEEANAAVSAYGRSKLKAEAYVKAKAQSWQVSIVRPPMVIGPRDPAMLDIFKMVKSGLVISPAAAPQHKTYSYVCAFDLVEFIHHILHHNLVGTFNCAYPKPQTLADIISISKQQLQARALILVLPPALLKVAAKSAQFLGERGIVKVRLTADKLHEILPAAWVCDAQKSQSTGFSYEWDLERTLKVTLQEYRRLGWL